MVYGLVFTFFNDRMGRLNGFVSLYSMHAWKYHRAVKSLFKSPQPENVNSFLADFEDALFVKLDFSLCILQKKINVHKNDQ